MSDSLPMYRNIPEVLNEFAKGMTERFPRDHWERYFFVALVACGHYISIKLTAPKNATFLRIDKGGKWGTAAHLRVLLIGETLFLLRNQPNFQEICDRMKTRELRSSFFEMLAARILFDNGFELHPTRGPRTRGSDYDFYGIRDGTRVNAEVTALTNEVFSEKTALNALNDKRKQLPKDAPAVIFCVLPDSWGYPPNLLLSRTKEIGETFLRPTEKINAVVFLIEDPIQWGSDDQLAGTTPVLPIVVRNPRPRMPVERLVEFRPMTPELRLALKTGDQRTLRQLRDTEFYDWVDSCEHKSSPSRR